MADSSFDESDSSDITKTTQRQIDELKKRRFERINAVVTESNTALENVRARVAQYQEERRTKNAEAASESLTKIMTAVERRMEIEDKMGELVAKMHQKTQAVEDMMKVGYLGRERDIKQS